MASKREIAKPSPWGIEAEGIHNTAMSILEEEAQVRQERTRHLRAARLERGASEHGAPSKTAEKKPARTKT